MCLFTASKARGHCLALQVRKPPGDASAGALSGGAGPAASNAAAAAGAPRNAEAAAAAARMIAEFSGRAAWGCCCSVVSAAWYGYSNSTGGAQWVLAMRACCVSIR